MYAPEQNPFLSGTFVGTWKQHFRPDEMPRKEDALPGLTHVSHPMLPLRVATGANHTKGMSHGPVSENARLKDYRPVLLMDVPGYFEVPVPLNSHPGIGVKQIRQYPGFLIDLNGLADLNAYLQQQFSKSSRYKLKKYRKRLETAFDIRYKMYSGDLDMETYKFLFDRFRALLEKRFDDKQISNNNLQEAEWNFYEAVTLGLMREGNAGLFVVYSGPEPIAVTLNYFYGKTVLDAITVFDIDYAKFHLGSVSVMGLIEWCLQNKMDILDFSKGYFDYKARWATRQYDFEYRVYYRKGNPWSQMLASGTAFFYRAKQWLREKGVNERLHRITYKFRSGNPGPQTPGIQWLETEDWAVAQLVEVSAGSSLYRELVPAIFEFLYLEQESLSNTNVFRIESQPNTFLIKGASSEKAFRITTEQNP